MCGDDSGAITQDGDEYTVLSGQPVIAGSLLGGSCVTTTTLVLHLVSLSFMINLKKSSPLPSQQSFIWVCMRALLSQQTVEALLRRVMPHNVVTALFIMQLLGMMSAGHVVIPLGLLHMRRLQRWFIYCASIPCLNRDAWYPSLPLWVPIWPTGEIPAS